MRTVAQEILEHNRQFRETNSTDLVTKVARMKEHVFPFYRATAHLFYRDMAALPSSPYTNAQTGRCWLAGDAHLANFGAMRDAAGTEVFGVSDFDEAYIGQYLWDLRRLAVSLLLADYAKDISLSERRAAIAAMATAYLACMADFKGSNDELKFRLTSDNTSGLVQKAIRKAAKADRKEFLAKFKGPDTRPVADAIRAAVVAAMPDYVGRIAPSGRKAVACYQVLDVRQRLGAGMGSLGKLRYYALLQGTGDGNVMLEMKQAIPSAVELANPGALPSSFHGGHDGQRIARAQQAMQLNADVLTGYAMIAGMPFHVHEKAPTDKDFKYDDIATDAELNKAAATLGMALASAHALADQDHDTHLVQVSIDKQVTDAVTSRSGFITELTGFACDYAAKVRLDWQAFRAALDKGEPMY
ncbi:hypothetical protein ASD15_27485 [Massilia sp. Root351]|jgi:uncharacterized protein (DUF2252 family)|uniref:DUF2252 domain-containing protein n=1 Tax=Massilia sp. Root351 TaxID=1736522 RepID=UPI00070FC55A|nr:DUF2252 family protein [Massilia sp. Root351]KQV87801.1 hypothetical protein ASD15_27485 [Massilia sp. Root351]